MNNPHSNDTDDDQGRLDPEVEKPAISLHLLIGGLMTLLAGILSVINGTRGIIAEEDFGFGRYGWETYAVCSTVFIAFGIVAIIGGYFAVKGRHILFAIISSALGMAAGGLLGFWLGLGAMVLFFLSNADLTE